MHGHMWTIYPFVRDALRPPRAPAAVRWTTTVEDPTVGAVPLLGWLSKLPAGRDLVVVVHGLGGDAASPYCVRFASVAAARGISTLRLSLRGAEGGGEDFYHAGLFADIEAALASPELADVERVSVVGFSMGGHLALHVATRASSRVHRVAAICSPVDLAATGAHLDGRGGALYRGHLLRRLRGMYRQVAARRALPVPIEEIDRVRTLREWDSLVVAPRFGFTSADHYYKVASVAPRLGEVAVPALLLETSRDPMVARDTVTPGLAAASPALRVEWLAQGGHVGFADDAAIYRRVLDFVTLG